MEEAAQADAVIGELTREIETVHKQTNETMQKNEADLLDAEATIEHLQSEIRAIASDSANVEGQFAQLSRELVGLKRQLIITEEEGASVKAQLEYNAKLRAQIRSVIDRTKQQQWVVASRSFYVLE
jgi:chromosome segregation ATPase